MYLKSSAFVQAHRYFERINIIIKSCDRSHSSALTKKKKVFKTPLRNQRSPKEHTEGQGDCHSHWIWKEILLLDASPARCHRTAGWNTWTWLSSALLILVSAVGNETCMIMYRLQEVRLSFYSVNTATIYSDLWYKQFAAEVTVVCYFLWVAFIAYGQFTYWCITPQLLLEFLVYASFTHTLHPAGTSLPSDSLWLVQYKEGISTG